MSGGGPPARAWPTVLEGFAIEHHAELASTQDVARARAEPSLERLVVVADVQTAGHGRQGRSWTSPAGNLYASIVLRRRFASAMAPPFSLIAAVALAETLDDATVTLKWPNDVLLGGRKVAGLLLEALEVHLVVGMGVNVTTAPVPEAASLACSGIGLDRQAVLAGVLVRLDAGARDLEDGNFAGWRQRWLARAAWLDEPVRVQLADRVVSGVHRGIDATGALLIETATGVEAIVAGDVERFRPEGTP